MVKSAAIILVGINHSGKSYQVKKLLSKVRNKASLFIFDYNKEYENYFPFPFIDFDEFTQKANRLNNAVIVFEEATAFLNNRSFNDEVNKLLVFRKHKNNTIYFIYHSLRSIPTYIYDKCNYIFIFKTNDPPGLSAKELKDERIEEIMLRVKDNKDLHYFETLKIY
jgi:hypothetical protein